MTPPSLDNWRHDHNFAVVNEKAERRTFYVLLLTTVTMFGEVAAGSIFGSMALLADGWHMATHVAAFLISIFAYRYARSHADDPAFAFGTGKVNALGGFASAVALAVVALVMCIESLQRLFTPREIQFNEAIAVAIIGLLVNIVSALLLKDGHEHHHDDHHERHHHHDHNLTAAYFHVIADALTSLLAIIALAAGKFLGWNQLDPVMGIVGAAIIFKWALGLVRQTSPILLDASIGASLRDEIIEVIEDEPGSRIADLHIWQVGMNHYAAIISVVTRSPRSAEHYKERLIRFDWLSHVTVEVNEYPHRSGG